MKNPFAPNGVTSSKIIYTLAKEKFGDVIRENSSMAQLNMILFEH